MRLNKIELRQFRLFENLTVNFDPRCTVLVGINGAGKSAVLDAAYIALEVFSNEMRRMAPCKMEKSDARVVTRQSGSFPLSEPQFPMEIKAEAEDRGDIMMYKCTFGDSAPFVDDGQQGALYDYVSNHSVPVTNRRKQRSIYDWVSKSGREGTLPVIIPYDANRRWIQGGLYDSPHAKLESRFDAYENYLGGGGREPQMLKWLRRATYSSLQEGHPSPELEAVRNAMSECCRAADSRIKRADVRYSVRRETLEIETEYEDGRLSVLPMESMSEGLKTMLMLVADIACRMALLNGHLLGDILKETDGVVLIDEIDLHLHPSWQGRIIGSLMEIFPKVQFIVSTHSPSVLSNIKNEQIVVLDHGKAYSLNETKTYGRDVTSILRDVMWTEPRPQEVLSLIDDFHTDLDGGNLQGARAKLDEMADILGENDDNVVTGRVSLALEED